MREIQRKKMFEAKLFSHSSLGLVMLELFNRKLERQNQSSGELLKRSAIIRLQISVSSR